jgi:hypothetical protein
VAVLLSYEVYQDLQTLREAARRQEALAQLRALAQEVQEKNRELTPSERADLADELTREAVDSLVEKGRIHFEEP